eukprot:m.164399 g.164399  ORF g.164399 m.164399 type:complete len:477 (+) comp38875_c0_seq2:62-1492(+)
MAGIWQNRWAIAVCAGTFVAFFFMGGMFYASGVLFSELLKPPCSDHSPTNRSSTSYWNSTEVTPTAPSRLCSASEQTCIDCVHESSNDTGSDCGGFGKGRGSTAWITSAYIAIGSCCGAVAGVLTDRFGCRPVAFTGMIVLAVGCFIASFAPSLLAFVLSFSVLGGLGFGLFYTSSIINVSQHWKNHLALANGIAFSGIGVGTVTFGRLAHIVIERFNWRGYLRFLGFAFTGTALVTLVFKEAEKEAPKKKLISWSLWKDPAFVLFMLGNFFSFLAITVPFVHMVRYALDLCICQTDADFLVTYVGVGSICGRLVIGFIGNHNRVKPLILFEISMLSCGIAIILVPSVFSSHRGLIAFMLIYGFCGGALVSFVVVAVRSVVSKDELAQAFGWTLFIQGPPNAIAAPIAGWLFDFTCSYTSAFYLGGSCFIASFIFLCFIPCVKKRSSQLPGSNQQMDLDMKKYTSPAKLQWTESSV